MCIVQELLLQKLLVTGSMKLSAWGKLFSSIPGVSVGLGLDLGLLHASVSSQLKWELIKMQSSASTQ